MEEAYSLTHSLRMIYNKNTIKDVARLSLARGYNKVADAGFKSFNTIAATIYEHYDEILNSSTIELQTLQQNLLMQKLKHLEHL